MQTYGLAAKAAYSVIAWLPGRVAEEGVGLGEFLLRGVAVVASHGWIVVVSAWRTSSCRWAKLRFGGARNFGVDGGAYLISWSRGAPTSNTPFESYAFISHVPQLLTVLFMWDRILVDLNYLIKNATIFFHRHLDIIPVACLPLRSSPRPRHHIPRTVIVLIQRKLIIPE